MLNATYGDIALVRTRRRARRVALSESPRASVRALGGGLLVCASSTHRRMVVGASGARAIRVPHPAGSRRLGETAQTATKRKRWELRGEALWEGVGRLKILAAAPVPGPVHWEDDHS